MLLFSTLAWLTKSRSTFEHRFALAPSSNEFSNFVNTAASSHTSVSKSNLDTADILQTPSLLLISLGYFMQIEVKCTRTHPYKTV